jgi:hypothetical protein
MGEGKSNKNKEIKMKDKKKSIQYSGDCPIIREFGRCPKYKRTEDEVCVEEGTMNGKAICKFEYIVGTYCLLFLIFIVLSLFVISMITIKIISTVLFGMLICSTLVGIFVLKVLLLHYNDSKENM